MQPPVLVHIINQVLKNTRFAVAGLPEGYLKNTYVLPLRYKYKPEMKSNATLQDYKNREFKDYSFAFYSNDHNGFFEGDEKDSWGIKCVLLPEIIIRRHVIFHYNTPLSTKTDKQPAEKNF